MLPFNCTTKELPRRGATSRLAKNGGAAHTYYYCRLKNEEQHKVVFPWQSATFPKASTYFDPAIAEAHHQSLVDASDRLHSCERL